MNDKIKVDSEITVAQVRHTIQQLVDKVAGYSQDNLRLRSELAAAKAAPALTPEFKLQCRNFAAWLKFKKEPCHQSFIRTVESWPADPPAEPIMKRPTIVCLCGSTRFYKEFQKANYSETMAGKIVLSIGFAMHASEEAHGEKLGCTPEQKLSLDELHKRKIDLADEVLILNVGGYIGASTKSELEYAKNAKKAIRFLEADPPAEPELLPCPCGNKNLSVVEGEEDYGTEWEISCSDGDCPWTATSGVSKARVIEYWNKRGDDAEFVELCRRMGTSLKWSWDEFRAAVAARYGGEAKTNE